MGVVGSIVLCVCAGAAAVGSIAAEFTRNHVYNAAWPDRARRTCARYGMLNCALGLLALALVVSGRPLLAGVLLLLADGVMLVAAKLPGVDIVAEGERVVGGLPSSYWMTFVHLALVLSGMMLAGAAQ